MRLSCTYEILAAYYGALKYCTQPTTKLDDKKHLKMRNDDFRPVQSHCSTVNQCDRTASWDGQADVTRRPFVWSKFNLTIVTYSWMLVDGPKAIHLS
jgi:hypothetical protein